MQITTRTSCRLCAGKDLIPVMPLAPTPLADDYVDAGQRHIPQQVFPLTVFLCKQCGHAQLLDVISPKDLYIDYIYETKSSVTLETHFDEYAAETVKRELPAQGSLVIDIGSNDGTLLRSFKRLGLQPLGVEPARRIAEQASQNDIPTIPRFFNERTASHIRSEYGKARIITANNIVANIDNLDSFFSCLKTILSEDGALLFESFYLGDFIKNMVFDFTYHEHLSYFSINPLVNFLSRHGLQLSDVVHTDSKGGSLRYIVHHADSGRDISSLLIEMQKIEREDKIQTEYPFSIFMNNINTARAATLLLLRNIKASGKSVAGYGASATSTTLLYHFGLEGLIDFFVDENPAKIGKLTPGIHIPVFSPEALYEKNPDYVFVAAWRFHKIIAAKHSRYTDLGGKWIIPLPVLKIFPEILHEI